MKIGVRLESMRLPVRRALAEAERLGVTGVQVDAVDDLAASALSQTGRREFRNLLRAHDLELTALGCPLRHGLDVVTNQQARIEHIQKTMELSFDLGARVVIVQAGRVPEKPEEAPRLTEALLALGHYGDRIGSVLALQTGLESGETLARYLAQFDTGGLGVNYDPANLLMNGFDPYESARALAVKIVHAHARDARIAGASRTSQEVPVGHGDIEWMRLIGVCEEIGYHGWLVVAREGGGGVPDVTEGVAFLRRFVR